MPSQITARASVVRFVPEAMRDEFEGGRVAVHDATELRILSPEEQKGRVLRIYHNASPPPSSPWRQVGWEVEFEISGDDLTARVDIFDGAVSRLRRV